MKLKKQSLPFFLFLACIAALSPISFDLYLPALPLIAREFSVPMDKVQWTLSIFSIGYAFVQLVYGPLTDRFGRRKILLVGMSCYVIGSFLCYAAQDIDLLIISRFIQAIGAGCTSVIVFSVVRDTYTNEKIPHIMASVSGIMAFVPLMAPTVGGVFVTFFSWHICFLAMCVIGVLIWCFCFFSMPETLHEEYKQNIQISSIIKRFVFLCSNRSFLLYTFVAVFALSGFLSFLAASSFVFQDIFYWSPREFGFAFGIIVTGFLTGTHSSSYLLRKKKISSLQSIIIGTSVFLFSGLLLISISSLKGNQGAAFVIIGMWIYGLGAGYAIPQASSSAISPFPEIAGSATSIVIFLQSIVGGIFGLLTSISVKHLGLIGMCIIMFTVGSLSFVCALRIYIEKRKNNNIAAG